MSLVVTLIGRREFFRRAAAGAALWLLPAELLAAVPQAEDLAPTRESLNELEWRIFEAIAARILPSDDGPGATEAGCVAFVDRALAHEESASRPLYLAGLRGVEAVARLRSGRSFAELDDESRDALLAEIERGGVADWPVDAGSPAAFFQAVRRHTILGFLADPLYGGNRQYAGWRATGYPGPRHHSGAKIARPLTPEHLLGGQKIVPIWEDTSIRTRFL